MMEAAERKVAFDFRQPLDATHWRRVCAVSTFLAPVIVAGYAVALHGEFMPVHAASRGARLVLTEVFVVGLFAAVSPHEPTGRATMVALACIVSAIAFSLLATFDRWSQWSASEGERAIRVGIPFAVSFLWLRLLYGYYWLQSCAAWKGFRLCVAATNCIRLVGVLLLRSAVSPAVAAYPPGQLPFEVAVACNVLLMLVPAALTPPNRMRLALASGLQTVRLSQLQPGTGSLAQAEADGATSPAPLHQPTASSNGSEPELIPAAEAFEKRERAAERPLESAWPEDAIFTRQSCGLLPVPLCHSDDLSMGSWGSDGRQSSSGKYQVNLSAGMLQRLNASLNWEEDSPSTGRPTQDATSPIDQPE